MNPASAIHTPDQRLRVFVSSTLGELAEERAAVRRAVEQLRLTPVMFEVGARPHPPRELYRAYLSQSHVFVGIYWERYGWVAPGEDVSGLEDEYRLAGDRPRLLYLKRPAPAREPRLAELVAEFARDDLASYKYFTDAAELAGLVADDLAVLMTERFGAGERPDPGELPAAPSPATPTLGRDTDIAAVTAALGGHRLVTLTGPGGIGKTRLALEVARRATTAGLSVGYVPLAEVSSSPRALRTLAAALGMRPEPSDLPGQLAERLRGHEVVLVLDNLEQITGIGPALADLLERAPGLRVLATSRRALRVRAERQVAVEPLGLPASTARGPEQADAAAVQLFLDRAAAMASYVEPDDLDAVAEICRQLDGLPLAIELAAARTRILSPATLLAQLTESIDVLRAGPGDLPARQRTLRATLDWSYGLLEPDQRLLLADLSVFSGGWTFAAARAVATPSRGDLQELLAALLDQSLVTVGSVGGGEPRFAMLGTVRSFAGERLAERADQHGVRQRHLDHFLEFGGLAQPFLCGPGQREWLGRVDAELDNLREAVGNALDTADDEAVIDIAWDVIVHFFVRDAVEEPDAWLRAVERAGRPLPPVTEARLGCLLALTRVHHGDLAAAGPRLRSALGVFRAEGMAFESAVALHQLGFVGLLVDQDPAYAVDALRESSALFDSVGHDWGVGLAEAMLGSVLTETGDFPSAGRHLERSLDRALRIDCEPQVVQASIHLALLRLRQGMPTAALRLLRDVEPLLVSGRFLTDASWALEILGAVAADRGRVEVARAAVGAAHGVRERLGVSPWPAMRSLVGRNAALVATGPGPPVEDDVLGVLHRTLAVVTPEGAALAD